MFYFIYFHFSTLPSNHHFDSAHLWKKKKIPYCSIPLIFYFSIFFLLYQVKPKFLKKIKEIKFQTYEIYKNLKKHILTFKFHFVI